MPVDTITALEAEAVKAEDLWRSGNWRGALDAYCALFNRRWGYLQGRAESLAAADLTILERIADLAAPFGRYKEADRLLEIAASGYARLGSPYWSDYATLKRIHLAFSNDLPYEARLLFQSMHSTLGDVERLPLTSEGFARWESAYRPAGDEEKRKVFFAPAYLELGRMLMLLGKQGSALAALRQGLTHAGPRAPALAQGAYLHLRLAIAQSLLERGDLKESSAELADIQPSIEARQHPGHLTTWLELQAKLDLLRGHFGPAQRRLFRVWEVCRQRDFLVPSLRAFVNLSHLFILLNKTIEAKALLLRVRSEAAALNEQVLVAQAERLLQVAIRRAQSDSDMAPSVARMQDGLDETGDLRPEAASFTFAADVSGLSLADFEERALQFHWFLGLRRWSAAAECLNRMGVFRSTESHLIHLRLSILRGMLEYYQGHFAEAEIIFRKARPELVQLELTPERWQLQVLWKRCLDRLNETPQERAELETENDSLLEEMGHSLPLDERIIFLLNKPTPEEEGLARLIWDLQDLSGRQKGANLFQRLRGRLVVWTRLNHLIDRIYRQREALTFATLRGSGSSRHWPRTPLWRRLLLCPPKQATLAFLVLPDSVFVVRLAWISMDFTVARVGRQRVRELVGRWHSAVPESRPDQAREAAYSLAQALGVAGLLDSLPPRIDRLRILPDDVLHGFPFAALEYQGRYLIERYAISIAFQPQPGNGARRPRRLGEAPLLVGVTEGAPRLPKTKTQVEHVQQWLARHGVKSDPLWNEAAPPAVLKSRLARATFLHISCHGAYLQNRPDATGLQLVTSPGSTAILGLPELFQLDLSRLQLATLISCWGADNFILPSRWIISMPEVLWRAGARGIVASLWEISEDQAREFVEAFYGALPRLSTDRALQKAQLAALKRQGSATADPVDWASFQIYGTPGRFAI